MQRSEGLSSLSLIQIKWCIFNKFLSSSGILSAQTERWFFPFFSWICRLSERILRPGRELWLFPSGTSIVTGPDPSRPPLRALLRPHRHPPRRYGPPSAGPPPFQRGPTLLWYHVPPPRGLPQPGARNPGAFAQHLLWSVRPQPAFYLTVAERQRIQQPPVPPTLGNERGHRVVALWRAGLNWAGTRGVGWDRRRVSLESNAGDEENNRVRATSQTFVVIVGFVVVVFFILNLISYLFLHLLIFVICLESRFHI